MQEETLAFVTDLSGLTFAEGDGPQTTRIEVCRDGQWRHPKYGLIKVTPEARQKFKANFDANVRKTDLPIDYDHKEGPAAGWIRALVNDGPSMFAEVELTPTARERVKTGEYRFFSPEWHPDWAEGGKKYGPTLFGGGLTNRPFFRGMKAINCSEPSDPEGGEEEPMAEENGGAAEETITPQQFSELNQRLTDAQAEIATLRAAEARRSIEDRVSAMRFSEGRAAVAPASRTALADALMGVPGEKRDAVLKALSEMQFAEVGERGFGDTAKEKEEDGETFTDAEERVIQATAKEWGISEDEVRQQFAEVRKSRKEREAVSVPVKV